MRLSSGSRGQQSTSVLPVKTTSEFFSTPEWVARSTRPQLGIGDLFFNDKLLIFGSVVLFILKIKYDEIVKYFISILKSSIKCFLK
jgi:hypothetical protein